MSELQLSEKEQATVFTPETQVDLHVQSPFVQSWKEYIEARQSLARENVGRAYTESQVVEQAPTSVEFIRKIGDYVHGLREAELPRDDFELVA